MHKMRQVIDWNKIKGDKMLVKMKTYEKNIT